MEIVTSTTNPAHRIAFGTPEAARGFIDSATDPSAWQSPTPAAASLTPPTTPTPSSQ